MAVSDTPRAVQKQDLATTTILAMARGPNVSGAPMAQRPTRGATPIDHRSPPQPHGARRCSPSRAAERSSSATGGSRPLSRPDRAHVSSGAGNVNISPGAGHGRRGAALSGPSSSGPTSGLSTASRRVLRRCRVASRASRRGSRRTRTCGTPWRSGLTALHPPRLASDARNAIGPPRRGPESCEKVALLTFPWVG
jgi:hypothetical protein